MRLVRRRDFVERREGAVIEFHHDALHSGRGGRYFQQIQVDGLVGAQHLTGRDAKCERIPDIACSARDGDGDWLFHDELRRQKRGMVAQAGWGPPLFNKVSSYSVMYSTVYCYITI